jgi:hypothetical protein
MMLKPAIPRDAYVFVGDGQKALFLRNEGDEKFPNLVTEKVFAEKDPPTHLQGFDPGALLGRIALAGHGHAQHRHSDRSNRDRCARAGLDAAGSQCVLDHAPGAPVALTALAAILAMISLSHSPFWGPMAFTIMGGLSVATFLTLFVDLRVMDPPVARAR